MAMTKTFRAARPHRLAALSLLVLLSFGTLTLIVGSAPGAGPAAAAASTGFAFPVTIHAANGAVHLKRRPAAIVSLSPTATEILYAIGAGEQVKAVDSYSDFPTGKTPMTKLNGNDPNVEAIASYKPDLVVVYQDSAGLNRSLAALGVPVLYQPAAATLSQAYAQYTQLGEATGHFTQAEAEVASVRSRIAGIVATTPKSAHLQTYYYELEASPCCYSVTSDTFVGRLLGLLGLKSIADGARGAAASGGYPQLNQEYVLNSDPTYVFLADTLCCGQSPASVAARPGWSALPAVAESHIVGLNDDIASRWGPRIVDLLQEAAQEVRHVRGSGS